MLQQPHILTQVARLCRHGILALLVTLATLYAVPATAAEKHPPIVFVHGNGDSAAIWIAQIWRFESNGYPRDRLFAIDMKYPYARGVDDKPQDGRSSTADAMHQLAGFVDMVRQKTGAAKVVLVGNSRGANDIRNYVKNGGGAAFVSKVVLGGGVNHGVLISDKALVGSEFNGGSAFMKQLNDGPNEVVKGVDFLTLRSDKNDKYAQPEGHILGLPGTDTRISYDAPALKGAKNLVLPGVDHRETAFSPAAFAKMYQFITGHAARRTSIAAEARPVLNGAVTGITAGVFDNVPVKDAKVTVFRVDPRTGARQGKAVHSKVTGEDGLWGPFNALPRAYYEFVVEVPGQPMTHIYRSPFPRGSDVVFLRPAQLGKGGDAAGSLVMMSRPRGYFGVGRDKMSLDGKPPAGLHASVPVDSTAKLALPAVPQRAVAGTFRGETITARNWPMQEKQVAIIEFTY